MYKLIATAALAATALVLPNTMNAGSAAPRPAGAKGDIVSINAERMHNALLLRLPHRGWHSPDSGISTVTIENGTTTNMSCNTGQSPIVCSPTGSGAVLSTSDLENYLAASSVTVTTNGSGGSQVADIDVESEITWSAATILTLDADQSINVSAPIVVTGSTAGLSFITNDGGSGGYLTFVASGYANFASISDILSINGVGYTLLNSTSSGKSSPLKALASAVLANPSGNFAFGASFDDKNIDHTWSTAPVPTAFLGNLQGLGNTISRLTITDSADNYVGLFQQLESSSVSSSISNLTLENVNVSSSNCNQPVVGALVGVTTVGGSAMPLLYNDNVSGKVAGATCTNIPGADAGGLVGDNGGVITASVSSARVLASYGNVGGLVGGNLAGGTISYSSASGAASGADAGGLAGQNGGTIENSTASGNVGVLTTGSGAVLGGLVGANGSGLITESSASGNVRSSGNLQSMVVGGLVGGLGCNCGGDQQVELSFATGDVRAVSKCQYPTCVNGSTGYVGGLIGTIGYNGNVENSYAAGSASCDCGTENKNTGGAVGGFIGSGDLYETASYSIGSVSWTKYTDSHGGFGGTCGSEGGGTDDYWNVNTSGTSQDGCSATASTTGEMTSGLGWFTGFDSNVWTYDPSGQVNGGYPYLICNPPSGTQPGQNCSLSARRPETRN